MGQILISISTLLVVLVTIVGCGVVPQDNAASGQPAATTESSSTAQEQGQPPMGISSGPSSTPGGELVASPTDSASGGAGQTMAGTPSGAAEASGAVPQSNDWSTYTDKDYGFSVGYPKAYVVLNEPGTNDPPVPGRIHQVRFQDQQLAGSDTADLQPPQFRVEVFDKPASATLEQWLNTNGGTGTRDAVQVGNAPGYRISHNTMQAPNQFFYTANVTHIYRLTPLGAADAMIASFQLR